MSETDVQIGQKLSRLQESHPTSMLLYIQPYMEVANMRIQRT